METINVELVIAILTGAIRSGTPLVFAGIGELVYEKSGVMNLGIEGIMLVGAMSSVWAQILFGNWVISLIIAVIVCSMLGAIHAFLTVNLRTNQIATGLAFVIIFQGLTAFWGKSLVGKRVVLDLSIDLPILSDIPIVGKIFFQQDILVFVAIMIAVLTWLFLYRTRQGIILRAVGESPKAAEASGYNIKRIRLYAGIFSGALFGLGGAHLSLVYVNQWQENMVAGRGWIALVMVIFALWRPIPLIFGAYFFGGLTALNFSLQAAGIETSPYFLGMLPFILTAFVLVASSILIKKRPALSPQDLGNPYYKIK